MSLPFGGIPVRFRKLITAVLVLVIMLLPAGVAYAETKTQEQTDLFEEENKEIKDDLGEVVSHLKKLRRTESAEKLQTIINKLDELDDDADSLKDVQGARTLIEQVISDEDVCSAMGWEDEYDTDAVIFETQWLNGLGEAVAPYGISMSSFTAEISRWGSKVASSGSVADDLTDKTDDSSEMIQKLRWSSSGSENGSKVSITSVLKEFETHFSGISMMLQSISAALVVAFGASNLLKMSSDRMAGYDAILREFLKMIFGVWFIFNYRYFAILLLRAGTYVTEVVLDGIGNVNGQEQTVSIMRHGIWSALNEMMQNGKVETYFKGLASAATGVYNLATQADDPWWTKAGTVVCSLFGGVSGFFVGGTLINVAINWVVFAILIELGIRYVFTPIAIADLYSEGYHSAGMRWLKKMLSCALSGALIYLTMYGANVIKTQLTGFHPLQLTAVNLTMTGFFAKCRQIADEIVGVR
jgi:hypothetical protein